MGTKVPPVTSTSKNGLLRISVCGVPFDSITTQDMQRVIPELLKSKNSSQIVFLRVPEFMRALRNPEYKACLNNADLVIPVSESLVKSAALLGFHKIQRHAPFDFTVHLLNILDEVGGSFYLLGDTGANLSVAEKNLKTTFPHAQALGRYIGQFSKTMETNILKAIVKASPNFLLTGAGPRGRDLWLYRRRTIFPRGIQVFSDECFSYFALRNKRPNKVAFRHGRDFFHEIQLAPWKIFGILDHLAFRFLILCVRLR